MKRVQRKRKRRTRLHQFLSAGVRGLLWACRVVVAVLVGFMEGFFIGVRDGFRELRSKKRRSDSRTAHRL